MKPTIWGKYIWNSIHLIINAYPDNPTLEDKKKYYNFFHSLAEVLPCSTCSNSFKQILQQYPISDRILSNKELFIKWGIDVHNTVNRKLGKKILSYDEAMRDINNIGKTTTSSNNKCIYIIVIVLIILIFAYLIMKN